MADKETNDNQNKSRQQHNNFFRKSKKPFPQQNKKTDLLKKDKNKREVTLDSSFHV